MKFTVNRKEEALLNEIDFSFMRTPWYDSSDHVLSLTCSEVRQVIEDLFTVIPLNFDKEDVQILCDFGWRLVHTCFYERVSI